MGILGSKNLKIAPSFRAINVDIKICTAEYYFFYFFVKSILSYHYDLKIWLNIKK